jgi:hypothetical protein
MIPLWDNFAYSNFHQVHYASNAVEALEHSLRHLFQVVRWDDAVDDDDGLDDFAPQPPQGCKSA